MFAGVSTGPCVASMPAAMVGADTTGGVVIGGVACGGGTDPDCIAVIAPSDSECAPAAAGCPVTIPVANDCPIDVGDTPCPRAAGDSDPPGIATGASGDDWRCSSGGCCDHRGRWYRSCAGVPTRSAYCSRRRL